MRKWNLFNFMEKKIEAADISAALSAAADQAAFKALALHIGISYIANALSKCEIKTYEDGKEKKDRLYYLLNVSPNPNQNASQFVNTFVEKYFYDGEALVFMHNDHLYCADSFYVDDTNPLKEFLYTDVTVGNQTLSKKFRAGEVFHFKLDNDNVRQLIEAMYSEYSAIISVALQAYKTTNGSKYKLILDNYAAGDTRFKELYENVIKKQLKTFIESDNAVYPQFKGTSLEEFVYKNRTDTSDIIAMRKEVFETTAQAFKIPLAMFYGNITNLNEVVKIFLTFCIEPLADMISEEITRAWYKFDKWKQGYYVEVDTSTINYVDIFEVAPNADKAIASGLASVDELRPRVRLKKLDTEFGGTHFITKNYEPAEIALNRMQSEEVKDDEEVLLDGEGE